MTTCSHTMINYHLTQNLKLLENTKFNHLTIILTLCLNLHLICAVYRVHLIRRFDSLKERF